MDRAITTMRNIRNNHFRFGFKYESVHNRIFSVVGVCNRVSLTSGVNDGCTPFARRVVTCFSSGVEISCMRVPARQFVMALVSAV